MIGKLVQSINVKPEKTLTRVVPSTLKWERI
jgi:hypothetical protein